MSTLVCFHAHPDDEAIQTGGTMARAHAEGHRVVLVVVPLRAVSKLVVRVRAEVVVVDVDKPKGAGSHR